MKFLIASSALILGVMVTATGAGYVPHHATSYASVVRHDESLRRDYNHALPYEPVYHSKMDTVMDDGYRGGDYYGKNYNDYYNSVNPNYTYKYGVKDLKTGDVKDAWESRDGDFVKGSYSLKEADGTTRVVDYTSDKHNGFNAVVKNLGHAYHPHDVYGHQGVTLYESYGKPYYY